MRVILFEKIHNNAVLLPKINRFIFQLFSGQYAVCIAKARGLISAIYDGQSLREEMIKDRMASIIHRKREALGDESETSDAFAYKKFSIGVRLLAELVTRYASSACRTMTKTVNLVGREANATNSTGEKHTGTGLEKVELRA